jgi:phosphatidate cytidylyltransferase
VPEDERDGDDLFEDLDKFFAPIKDVEWEEPDEAPPPATSTEEEHVTVRPEPEAVITVPASSEGDAEDEAFDDEGGVEGEAEETWYDTAALEPVDEAFGSVAAPAHAEEPDLFSEGSSEAEAEWEADDELEGVEQHPSADELEEAAAHFAEPGEAANPRVVQIDEENASDLMDELGAEPYGPEGEEADEEEDVFAAMAEQEPHRTVVVGTEGLGGPRWQEPAAVEVGADLDRRVSDRDVPAAFLTGIVLAAVAVVALLIGEGVFAIAAGIVALVAQGELYGVMVKHHRQPATAVGLVSGALMLGGAYYQAEAGLLAMLSLGLLATFLWYMTVPASHRKDTASNIGLTLLGLVWIPGLAGTLLIILTTWGKEVVVAVIALTFVFDTAAFLIGSVWGGSFIQRPLAPATSPKKSIEGLVGAALITMVVSSAFVTAFVNVAPGIFEDGRVNALLLGVVVSLAATFGDLAESLVKRDVGVKDMGSVLPGHGGVLDRIDSLLFVAPAALLLLRVIAF